MLQVVKRFNKKIEKDCDKKDFEEIKKDCDKKEKN